MMTTERLRAMRFGVTCLAGCLLLVLARTVQSQAAADYETPEYFNQYGLPMIGAAQAYQNGYTGRGITVGVADSGILSMHQEFLGTIAGGWDFHLNRPVHQGSGFDSDGHGSHVSGIIAANRDGREMHGVAFDAQILSARLDTNISADATFSQTWNYLATQNLSIINNSLGVNDCAGPFSRPPCNVTHYTSASALALLPKTYESFERIQNSGALMVFATGNEQQPHPDLLAGTPYLFPKLGDNWLAVAAVGSDGLLAPYSNRCGVAQGWCLSAPGGDDDEDVSGIYSVGVRPSMPYIRYSGTSMATPHVAGAAALVKQAYPFFDAYQLQQTLLTTATYMGDPDVYGWGMLNVGRAVRGPARFTDGFDLDTQGYNTVFHHNIDGTGGLIKRGAGRLILAGYSSYTGPTDVSGGQLVVNGSVLSSVRVHRGGILSGSGRVGALDNAGVVAPGNSIGTLTVDGDYTARPGSVHQVEVNGNGHDQLVVAGRATLQGGAVEIQKSGLFSVGADYSILRAAGGVTGRYDAVHGLSNLPLLTSAFEQSQPGLLNLQILRSQVPFTDFLETPNQRAVGQALDAVSNDPPVALKPLFDPLLNSDGSGLKGQMAALSGEAFASTQSVLQESGVALSNSLMWRMSQNLTAGWLPGAPLAQASPGLVPQSALPRSAAWPLWVDVSGGWGTLKGTAVSTVKTHSAGLVIGGDAAVGRDWRLGAALALSEGYSKVDELASRSDLSSQSIALYGGRSWSVGQEGHALKFSAGLTYTHHSVDSRRFVSVGGDQTLRANYTAQQMRLFTQIAYNVPLSRQSWLEPYLGASWQSLHSGSFSESGGVAALRSGSRIDKMHSLNLGVRFHAQGQVSGRDASFNADLGWVHSAGQRYPERQMAFVAQPAVGFSVTGVPIAANTAQIGLQAQIALDRHAALGVAYTGEYASGKARHAATLFLRVRF